MKHNASSYRAWISSIQVELCQILTEAMFVVNHLFSTLELLELRLTEEPLCRGIFSYKLNRQRILEMTFVVQVLNTCIRRVSIGG